MPLALFSHEKIFVIFRIGIFASTYGKLVWSAGIVQFLQEGQCCARAVPGILSVEYFRRQLKCPSISSVKPKSWVYLSGFVPQLNTPPDPTPTKTPTKSTNKKPPKPPPRARKGISLALMRLRCSSSPVVNVLLRRMDAMYLCGISGVFF